MLHNSEFNRDLMKKIGFPEEAQYCFTRVFEQLDENKEWGDELDAIYEEYMFPWADELNKALEKVTKLAVKMEKPAPTMHMAFLLCCGSLRKWPGTKSRPLRSWMMMIGMIFLCSSQMKILKTLNNNQKIMVHRLVV